MIETHRPSLKEIEGKVPWSAAEERLKLACGTGEVAWFGNELPTEGSDENTIRAGLVRHIMLGGCDDVPVHAKGVQIQGAWITSVLDLQGCESSLDLDLAKCHFNNAPILRDARLGSVMLPGCAVPELNAQRLTVVRDVLLNKNFISKGKVNLSSAQIGGTLACTGSTFNGAGEVALDCGVMTVGASVRLNDGFVATGQVILRRAQITGLLECSGGKFDEAGKVALNCNAMRVGSSVFLRNGFVATGQVSLFRVQIVGNLQCTKAEFRDVLVCDGMTVDGGMYWHDVTKPPKAINLTDAHVGALRDDDASWKDCIPVLNGFRYDRIISEITVRERLAWLGRKFERPIIAAVQTDGVPLLWLAKQGDKKFDPQPYSQLATTLRAQGNASGAARVLVAREKRLRRAGYLRAQAALDGYDRSAGWTSVLAMMKRLFEWAFGLVFGYGHQFARAIPWIIGIWAFCFWLYGAAYNAGQMAPNSDVVLTSQAWLNAAEYGCAGVKEAGCEMPLHLWNTTDTAIDYETFNRGLYALDLFVPLDALGQENAWAPSKDRGNLGWWAYYLRWAVQMSGWVITAVAAAALTGVIGRKE